jgi:phosphoribosylformylglycinamidine cyclo-ligase
VFALIQRHGDVPDEEMWEVFNMGCGFVAVVPDDRAQEAAELLANHHAGTRRIGSVIEEPGRVRAPGVEGDSRGLSATG